MKINFIRSKAWLACAVAGLVLLRTSLVFATPQIGHVWQRSVDWTVPPASAAGTTNGNPAADAQGNVVWQYESVPLGQALGQPATGGEAPAYWCLGVPTNLTWDASWFGGSGGWTGGDDIAPLIQQTNVVQGLDNTSVPVVRWLNPTASNLTVALAGTLELSWSDPNLEQPVDFIMMLQKADGSTTPLLLGCRKPASFSPNLSETPLIEVELPALQIPAGGSIFYTLRYEDATAQSGSVALDDSGLTITLKALAAVPLPANDTAVTDENELVNVEVLANDQWAPQSLPRVSIAAAPAHGTAVVRADQSIDYTPATNFTGTDVLIYQIFDGAATANATLTVTVNQPCYLYVSPGGNDTNTGTAWTNALATITGARNQIRNWRAQNAGLPANTAVEVVLDDGVYPVTAPIIFTAPDAGSPQAPVTYRARHALQATISGGQNLNLTWQPYAAAPGAFVASLGASGLTQNQLNHLHTLFVNGVRAARARLPDTGFYTIVSADPDTGDTFNKMNSFTFGSSNGQPDISAAWTNLNRVEVVSYATWTESRMPIASVDAANRRVHIQGSLPQSWADDYLADYGAFLEPSAPYSQTGATDGTIRYYLENVLEGLDAPGEWYVDPVAAQLYYYPRAGETITNDTFVVPVVDELMQVTNASNLRFDGLVFSCADWYMPATGQPGLGQAISMFTTNAIVISAATNVVFANGRVTQTGGGYGLQLQYGGTGNSVINTEFVDNAGGGVIIGGTPGLLPDTTEENGFHSYLANDRVSLNLIHDNNTVWREAPGIIALRNGGNRISGNTLSNLTYGGINVGWFDTDPLAVGHNQLAWNKISNFGTLLYDLAGIYAVGSQPGTTIMGNTICDLVWTANHLHRLGVNYQGLNDPADDTLPWNNPGGPRSGIYTDDTSKGQLVDGNIIDNCNGGIFIHDLHDDIYLNNLMVDTTPEMWATIYAGNSQDTVDAGPFWIASSVIAWTQTNAAPPILFDSYQPPPWFFMDKDVYSYGPAAVQSPENYGLPYLQSAGHEQDAAVTANPLFVSPATQDYRIALSAQPFVLAQGFSADWLFESAASPFTAAPVIDLLHVSGGNLVIGGTNCPAGAPYRILSSTNVRLPLAQWQAVTTNTFLSDGSWAFTNSTTGAAAFFRLVSP